MAETRVPYSETGLTHRRVLRIAGPIMLSNATVPLLGAMDTAIIGQLGQAALIGAVGIGAVILAAFYWVFGFLRMGTSGLAAQARGAGDGREAAAILIRAVLTGIAAGIVLVLLQPLLFTAAFRIAPASQEVESLARVYLGIRIWGAPATIALYAITGWLIAMERTRGVLFLQLWMNGLNAVLSFWFVLGLGAGVAGVAIATLIAEATGLALGLWLCRDGFRAWPERAQVMARGPILRMLRVNSDIMIRSVALQGSFVAFMFLGAGLGDVTLAANQVLLQFIEVTAYALDGFAFAAEALVGQAIGARSAAGVRRASLLSSQWGLVMAGLLSAVLAATGAALITLMARDPAVQAEAVRYLPWVVAIPVLSVGAYMLDGIFIGATATRDMRNATVLSVAIFAGVVALMLPPLGNHGLWAGLVVLNVSRMVTLLRVYPRIEAMARV